MNSEQNARNINQSPVFEQIQFQEHQLQNFGAEFSLNNI